jgi:molecular chaperone HtpG
MPVLLEAMNENGELGERHVFKVSMGGLLELLSGALYTSESVFVRELIQNGVDAVAARRGIEPEWTGRVHLQFFLGDDGRGRLVVEDDGIGLSAEEVHRFLATIGASTKRGTLDRDTGFIGQFGVGFLSCFMVADEVTLVTRRAGMEGARPLQWHGSRDGTYTLEELPGERSPGSVVYLTLKEDTRYDAERLLGLARKFGGFLAVPVEFSGGEFRRVRVNPDPFPWETGEAGRGVRQKRWLDFGQEVLGTRFYGAFRVECLEGGVSGLAFIQREAVGVLDVPQHMVFLKGMFLSRDVEGLAPREMPFLRCVVNATGLKPNAAREGVQDAETALAGVRGAVGRGLTDFLEELSREDPRLLAELVGVHHRSFVELAAVDPEILRLVGPHMVFETSLGPRSLETMGWKDAFFIEGYEDFKRVEALAAAHQVLVVNAGYSGVGRLFRRLDGERSGRKFKLTTARELMREWTREVQVSVPLKALLERARKALRPVRAGVVLSSDMRSGVAATVEVAPGDSARRRGAAADFFGAQEEGAPVLVLNTAHFLVQLLCEPGQSEARVDALIVVLYHHALLAARELPLQAEKEMYHGALEALLEGAPEGT